MDMITEKKVGRPAKSARNSEMVALKLKGVSYREIAKTYNVKHPTVVKIIKKLQIDTYPQK